LYALQLEQYLEHFDAAQILVLWSDDLKERRGQTLARAFSFIDVDPDAELSRTVLGREFNRVDAQRAPTRLYGPALRLAARTPLTRLSLSSRRRLSRLAQRRIAAPDSTLAPDVEARLWEQIAPDSTRLEALVGDTPPWLRERERSVGG
jgi:hypothetical protein